MYSHNLEKEIKNFILEMGALPIWDSLDLTLLSQALFP